MKIHNLSLVPLTLFSFLCADEPAEPNIARVSEAFGHIIYENFERLNVKFDLGKIISGIEDAAAGKESPLTKKECIDAIHFEQEKKFKILCAENLHEAEIFLASNAQKEGVICLEEGKVQYRLVSLGKGPEVKLHSSPLIRCKVTTLHGLDLWSPPIAEEPVSLDETIAGLKTGLLGMKEGEKRILYIHPDLAYGEKAFDISLPNVILIFEVEVLKADDS